MKFLVDLWLDGYDTEEGMKQACLEFIEESLNFSFSSVTVEVYNPPSSVKSMLDPTTCPHNRIWRVSEGDTCMDCGKQLVVGDEHVI